MLFQLLAETLRQRCEAFGVTRLEIGQDIGVVAIAQFARVRAGQRGVFACGCITQVAVDVHRLVVAHEVVYTATLALGLVGELAHMRDDFRGIGTAIRNVANLHEMRITGLPAAALVDDSRRLQCRDVTRVVAVDIPYRDDPVHASPVVVVDLPR